MNKQKFNELLKPLIEIYDSIEMDMILDMLDRIDNYNSVKGTLKWYLDKLTELKVFEKYNKEIVKKNKKQIKKALEEILESASKNAISVDTLETFNKYTKSNITIDDIYNNNSATNIIKEALKSTENICNLINTKAIQAANEEYRNILNKAYLETSTGIYTYDQSIKLAIDKMAENGIMMANYVSGRKISIESAVRRDVITRANKLVGDIELEAAKEMDTNLVYVDQHLGARTRNKYMTHDYEAHDEWQGKVYMIEGSSDKYANFYEKTGYGEMLGLKGINCYHDFRPYFEWEGIPKEVDINESRRIRKLYDKQREYERKIRHLKREKIINGKMGNTDDYKKAKEKLALINHEYNDFLKENNLNRKVNREYVSKKINVLDAKNKQEKNKPQLPKNNYIDVTREWLDSATPNSNIVEDRQYFEHEGIKYKVDDKNVVLDYSSKEREVAEWLESTFGGEIYMLPRINTPEGIKTADYLFKDEYWDLKEITGVGKNILFHAIEDHEKQAHNFIFDISKTKLSNNEIIERLNKLYSIKKVDWLNKIIVKREEKIIKITKRSDPSD